MRRFFRKEEKPKQKANTDEAESRFARTQLVLPDNIEALRKHLLSVLSDPERANDFVRSSGFVKNMFQQPVYKNLVLTFPTNFLMQQQELPKAHRLVDVRRDAAKYVREKAERADLDALPFDERFPGKCAQINELNPALFQYFNRLPTEDQILIICVIWSFAADLHSNIESQIKNRYDPLEKRSEALEAIVRETNEKIREVENQREEHESKLAKTNDTARQRELKGKCKACMVAIEKMKSQRDASKAELKNLQEEMTFIVVNELAGITERWVDEPFKKVIRSLTAERVADALLRFHLDMPAFCVLADELTKIEMMTGLDEAAEAKRQKYIANMRTQITASIEGIPANYSRGRDLEYQRLFPVCHALWREIATREEKENEDAAVKMLAGMLKLSTLSDESFEAQANANDAYNNNNIDPEIPQVKSICDNMNVTMRKIRQFITKTMGSEEVSSDVLQNRMMKLLSPILRDDNLMALVMNPVVLEKLEKLANNRAWGRMQGGKIALENFKLLLKIIVDIRTLHLWEKANTGLNLDEVTLNDLFNLYNYRRDIMKRRIQGIRDAGGLTGDEMDNQLAIYDKIVEEWKVKTHHNGHELDEVNKKAIIFFMIKEVDTLPLKLSTKKSISELTQLNFDSIAAIDVKLLNDITFNLQRNVTEVTTDDIDNLVQWIRLATPSAQLQKKQIEINFMQQCVHIIRGQSPVARSIGYELLELLKDKANYRDGCELNLRGCDLSNSKVIDIFRSRLRLSQANLTKCSVIKCQFTECTFDRAIFEAAKLELVQFIDSNMMNVDLTGAALNRVRFVNSDLSGAKLQGAKLIGVDFVECNLTGVSFADVEMDNATLSSLLYPMDRKLTDAEWDQCFSKMSQLNLSPAARISFINDSFKISNAYTAEEQKSILATHASFEMSLQLANGMTMFNEKDESASPGVNPSPRNK